MKAIYDAKILEIDRDWIEVARHDPYLHDYISAAEPCNTNPYKVDVLHGRRFILRSGEVVCLGVSDEIYQLLEIPLNCFDDMSETICDLTSELSQRNKFILELKKEIKKHNSLNFFERLKFLFKFK
jgi:hypothetical protein